MGPEVVIAEACRVDQIDDPGGFSMTFRTITKRLTLAAAIAALATSAAVQATPASASPPDSGLGANGAGDGPVGPSGCRGDCGIFGNPNPKHPGGVVRCKKNPLASGCPKAPCPSGQGHTGYCLPPASPTAVPAPPAKTIKCTGRMLDGTRCPGADGFPPIVLKSLAAQCAQGNANSCVNYDKAVGRDTPATPDAAVDCAKTPENANCDPDGHWCYDHPEDPNCAGVTGTYCDEHPDAAECNIDQAQGFAAAPDNVDNGAGDPGADPGAVDPGAGDPGAADPGGQ